MPRYYFHLHDDMDVPDPEGTELPNVEAALASAMAQGRQMAGDLVKEEGRLHLSHRIDIEDALHSVLDTVLIRDVVTIRA
jgi:hypothetical protein